MSDRYFFRVEQHLHLILFFSCNKRTEKKPRHLLESIQAHLMLVKFVHYSFYINQFLSFEAPILSVTPRGVFPESSTQTFTYSSSIIPTTIPIIFSFFFFLRNKYKKMRFIKAFRLETLKISSRWAGY